MSDSLKTPKPTVPFDWQFVQEESHVRDRELPTDPMASPSGAEPPRGVALRHETVSARTARIDQKMSVANLLLRRLSPLDPRARLLGSAVLRRDEVLLDAVLGQMTEEVFALVRSR